MVSILALRLWQDLWWARRCVVHMTDWICQHTGYKQAERWKTKNLYCLWLIYGAHNPCNPSATTRFTLRPAELHIFHSTKEQRHVQNICGTGGAKCWHPLARWMVLALTERSFPAHLHSSLLVGEAGQGICNKNTVPVHVRKETSPPRISFYRATHSSYSLCACRCIYEGWRGHNAICYPLCFSLLHYSSRCAESS